jgi:hypothetical protein
MTKGEPQVLFEVHLSRFDAISRESAKIKAGRGYLPVDLGRRDLFRNTGLRAESILSAFERGLLVEAVWVRAGSSV